MNYNNYNPIADGAYVRGHRRILKDLGSWAKMTGEEKAIFRTCHSCEAYNKHLANEKNTVCPCYTCKHRKTEVQIDNHMKAMRRKYLD